jgi:putative transposase
MLACVAGWLNDQQRLVIEYLKTENAVLREKLGKKRILLNDAQRRRLAVKGKLLGRKQLKQLGSFFSPDTILRWHRQLVTKEQASELKIPGRPKLDQALEQLIVRLANDNSTWGCDRIVGELKKLGHSVSGTTVENVLKRHGIEPAPTRGEGVGSWSEFIRAHWECLAATDFTTVNVWTATGLKTFYLLFVIELKSRRVQYLGSTQNPNEAWVLEAFGRATAESELLGGEQHPTMLLMDHDTKFTAKLKRQLRGQGISPKMTGIRQPNMNAYVERFIGSYKFELARRMIFFGQGALDHATKVYLDHYHDQRPHQGLDNELIVPLAHPSDLSGEVVVTERLGGLLKSYHRAA